MYGDRCRCCRRRRVIRLQLLGIVENISHARMVSRVSRCGCGATNLMRLSSRSSRYIAGFARSFPVDPPIGRARLQGRYRPSRRKQHVDRRQAGVGSVAGFEPAPSRSGNRVLYQLSYTLRTDPISNQTRTERWESRRECQPGAGGEIGPRLRCYSGRTVRLPQISRPTGSPSPTLMCRAASRTDRFIR